MAEPTITTIYDRETLFAHLQAGAYLVTPNNCLSHHLVQDYFNASQVHIQEKPRCLAYPAFLLQLFKQIRHLSPHTLHPLVLTPAQQTYLWRQVLLKDHNNCYPGLLHAVQQTWSYCQLWQINPRHPAFFHNPQTKQFQHWHHLFCQRLRKLGAITEAQLVNYLLPFLSLITRAHQDKLSVIWACFDEYTPQQHSLQHMFTTLGCAQLHYDLPQKPITTECYPALDEQDESLQMIQWLQQRIAAEDKCIAVVALNLPAQAARLQRLFARYIPQIPFNSFQRESLANVPIISHALAWINLDTTRISNHTARLLLASPYLIGAKKEFIGRAKILQENAPLGEEMLSLAGFAQTCAPLAPQLAQVLDHLSPYPAAASIHAWISHFKTRLHQLGFPGEYPLSATIGQSLNRFMSILDEFLQFAILSPRLEQHEALSALQQLAEQTFVQKPRKPAAIRIISLQEASGCTFDSVWVYGLTDACIPHTSTLSAFIPIQIQQEYGLYHSSADSALQLARRLHRLQQGCQRSVFSYATLQEDIPHMPSPLLNNLPRFQRLTLPPEPPILLVKHVENYAVPFLSHETMRGSTALLTNQAKCSFRAFAAHRLHAKPEPEISLGLNARERGQIMHHVMDQLWKMIGTQQQLLLLNNETLAQHIHQAIQHALTPFTTRDYSFPPVVQQVEIHRLTALAQACLAWEQQRPPFEVEAVEQAYTLHLAGLDFHLRVDRLDRVEGKKWIIDYKSGAPRSPWYQERPEEPQLLLYALLDKSINTLLFLQLKAGQLNCSGLSENGVPISGVAPLSAGTSWPEQQQRWLERLSTLANEFRAGHCLPQPARAAICQTCDFHSLCRTQFD